MLIFLSIGTSWPLANLPGSAGCNLQLSAIAGQCLLALCPGPAAPGTRNMYDLQYLQPVHLSGRRLATCNGSIGSRQELHTFHLFQR